MKWAQYFLSVPAVYVVYTALGWVIHEYLLREDYKGIAAILRDPADVSITLIMVSNFVFALAFCYVYAKGVESKPWLAQGLRYGLAIAVLAVLPQVLISYAVHPIPQSLAVKWAVYETLATLITGVAAAWCYRA